MKPYTQQEIAKATSIAYRYTHGYYYLLLRKPFRYDGRTRIGRLSATLVNKLRVSEVERQEIINKRKQRCESRHMQDTGNVLTNKLFVDFRHNRGSVTGVYNDRISFYGRNHWAKTPIDFKVLSVLKRNYMASIGC